MPRIKIISAPKLNSYKLGGEENPCGEGFIYDPASTECIPDPNYSPVGTTGNGSSPADNGPGDYEEVPKFQVNTTLSTGTPKTGPGTGVNPATAVKKPSFLSKAQKFNKKYMSPFAKGVGAAIAIGTPYKNFFEQRAQQKAFNSKFRNANFTRADVSPGNEFGNFDINQGIFKSRQQTPWNEGAFTNQFDSPLTAQFGGSLIKDTDMEKIKVRITGLPSKKYGGQSEYGLDKGWRIGYTEMPEHKREKVSKSLEGVPRDQANIEAEKGETVYGDMDGDGALEHFNIGGKRHSEGGTPLKVPEGSFIFSDTKKMTIKDPKVLSEFGISSKTGATPADIAKKYDVNKYKAIMEDPNTDSLMKETAQMMVKNYENKLARLAFIQEKMKGFPQGIPEICKRVLSPEFIAQAEDFIAMQKGEQPPSSLQQLADNQKVPQQNNQMVSEQPEMETPEEQMSPEEEIPEEAYGGSIFDDGGEAFLKDYLYHQYSDGGLVMAQNGYQWNTPDIEKAITTINSQTGKRVVVSPRVSAGDVTIPGMQHKQKSGLYGEITPDLIDEFKQRHKWYFKDHPNWNANNPNDVLDFQTKYDAEFAKKHGFVYFPGDKKYNKKDRLFGEYTYNAPGLEEEAPPVEQPKKIETPTKTADYFPPGTVSTLGKKQEVPFKWMTPDKLNLAATLATPPKKYLPWFANVAYEPSQLALEDWRGPAAAAFSAGYAAPAATFSQFASTQGSKANLSNLAAKAAENVAGIASGVTGKNVDRVNQFLAQERQRKDQFNLLRAERANKEYLGNVVANQQYDNALRQYLNNFAKAYGQGWKNRMQLGMLNAVNPMYNVDPRSGYSYFVQGYDPSKFGTTASSVGTNGYTMQDFSKLKQYYMDNGIFTDPDKAADAALKDIRSSKSTAQTNPALMMPSLYGSMLGGYNQQD